MEIADRLKEFSCNYGTIKDFAAQLDMSPQTLHVYLAGKSEPGAKILTKLHNIGCNINWLLTGEGEMLKPIEKATDTLGDRLNTYIQKTWKSNRAFSDIVNTHPNLIRTYIANKSIPGGALLGEVAKLGLNINWLLTGEAEMLTNKAETTPTLKCPHCDKPLQITIG